MDSKFSFINGTIAGAGIALSVISIALLQVIGPLEGKIGITTTEVRIAIFLGFVVFTVSLLYEIYRKKDDDKQNRAVGKFKQSLSREDSTK